MIIKEIGQVYSKSEPTVSLELNLDDLYWLQGFISYKNGFWRDLQDGIDAIEERNRILSIQKSYGLSIVIMESNPSASGNKEGLREKQEM